MTLLVTNDTEGLRMAALELFEAELYGPDLERQIGNLPPGAGPEEIEKLARPRRLSPGYEDFLVYVLWLESMNSAGVQMQLNADEAEGLRAVAAARAEFRSNHPECPACGVRQYNTSARTCRRCMKELR
jgi:hypothetical protein